MNNEKIIAEIGESSEILELGKLTVRDKSLIGASLQLRDQQIKDRWMPLYCTCPKERNVDEWGRRIYCRSKGPKKTKSAPKTEKMMRAKR